MTPITVSRIEEELKKTKRDQDMILDHVPAMVYFKDRDNRFIRVNKVFADFLGLPKRDIEGKSAFDFYPKKQAETFWNYDKEVIATRSPKKNIIESIKVISHSMGGAYAKGYVKAILDYAREHKIE